MKNKIGIHFRNGGCFEKYAFKYIIGKIFDEYEVYAKYFSNVDKEIYVFGSLPEVPDYTKGIMIKENNEKTMYKVHLDESFGDNIVLFFSGERWDIDYVPYDDTNKCVVFSPFRDDRLNGVFKLPWISIIYIQFHLINYIDKYQKQKDYSNKKHHIAYCVKCKTKDRTTFMNLLVKKFETTGREKEIFSLGQHKIDNTTHEIIRKYISPNTILVDKFNEFKFACVFENNEKPGYVSEKLLQAFLANTIPIYQGDHILAKQLFNPKGMICVRDFESYDDCIDFIYNMTEDSIQNMLNEPMFTDGKIPELFDITNFESGFYGDVAKYIRSL